jgi:hypothetical protein
MNDLMNDLVAQRLVEMNSSTASVQINEARWLIKCKTYWSKYAFTHVGFIAVQHDVWQLKTKA